MGGENWLHHANPSMVLKFSRFTTEQPNTNQTGCGYRTNLRTEAEPQQIVAQGLLSCLQYPVPVKSSTEDLTRPTLCIALK